MRARTVVLAALSALLSPILPAVVAVGVSSLASPATVRAQQPTAAVSLTGRLAGHDSLIVSILTMGQGRELFDRFGHMSIRVQAPAIGLDSAWNWGMYDFNTPGFIPRFLSGETQYWMAGFPTPALVNFYAQAGRGVWEQELSLNAREADSLLTYLRWNAKPENKFYRYDYYLDNCATRVRDVIDAVTGGELKRALAGSGSGMTWRGETVRLSDAFPVIGFGMSYALGARADVPLTTWEELFIPMHLRDAIRALQVQRAGEPSRALVSRETVLVPESAYVEAAAPRSFLAAALATGIVLALIVLFLSKASDVSLGARTAMRILGVTWHFVAGMSGTLVLLAGLLTRHVFMGANTGVLLGTPVSLALVLLVVPAWSKSPSPRKVIVAANLALFTFGAASLTLISHAIPSLAPADLSAVALALPVHAAFAYALHVRVGALSA